jgi:hypothetical protein
LQKPKNAPNLTLTIRFDNDMNTVANKILKGPTDLQLGNDTLGKILDSMEISAKILDQITKVSANITVASHC